MTSTGDACGIAHPDEARTEVVRLPGGASLWVVRAEGGLRDAGHPALSAATPHALETVAVVIDLTWVPLVSAAGVRALVSRAHDLADGGIKLLVATTDETIGRVLAADGALTVVPGVAEAAATCTPGSAADGVVGGDGLVGLGDGLDSGDDSRVVVGGDGVAGPGGSPAGPGGSPTASGGSPAGPGGSPTASGGRPAGPGTGVAADTDADDRAGEQLVRLRAEVRNLRAKARTHPLVSRAQGILEERYRLPDDRAAFHLMEASSQRFNVRLRTLASAVVTVPRPRSPHAEWFPGRERRIPPALAFHSGLRAGSANSSEVLGAVLRRSMEITETTMGNVQLVDPVTGSLRLEKSRGLDEDFEEFFDRVDHTRTDGAETSCAVAARLVARVTVTDVATDTVFTERARRVLLAAGSRGCHSTPLTAAPGRLQGVVSTHHTHPVRALTAAQARALDEMGAQAGRWLDWYQRTVVLDALEDLHHRGSTWA
ncbi:ANTAR domain-containing protein [Streptomyces sp. PU-14G]|uniref:ANTAR domain-containing protein n=1 Tax=Streptomyces sp. PU-14G TaxID=2800808 RepID=UPI0034DE53D1